jgi:hypothetical protein
MDSPGVINTCTVSIAKVGAFFAIQSFSLQGNVTTEQKKLFLIEWAYQPLLDWHSDGDGSPVTLENRLASDPNFFCELIQWTYRAKGEKPKEEPSPQQNNIK